MAEQLSNYLLRDLARPRWLSGRRATGFLRSFCQVADGLAQDVFDARNELMIVTATIVALAAHARNANDRTFAREAMEALRAYLQRRFEEKKKAGTEDGLHAQFARLGCPNIEIVRELDLRTAGAVNGFGGNIGFFFVFIRQPHPFQFLGLWDGGDTYDNGLLWGGSTNDQSDLQDVLRRWKASGTSCRFVVFDVDGSAGWNATGLTGNYQTIAINEPWEALPPDGVITPYYNVDFLTP